MKKSNSKPELDLSRAELNARLDALRRETTPRRTFFGRVFALLAGFFAFLTLGCKKWSQPLCYSQPCPESLKPELSEPEPSRPEPSKPEPSKPEPSKPEPSEPDEENQPLCYEPPELPPEEPEGEEKPKENSRNE